MLREHDTVPDFVQNTIAVVRFPEEALQTFGGDIGLKIPGIESLARELQRRFMQVGGKDLELWRSIQARGGFQQQDGNGISFLSSSTANAPYPNLVRAVFSRKQLCGDFVLQYGINLGITEEISN